jgi:hypothetical protein
MTASRVRACLTCATNVAVARQRIVADERAINDGCLQVVRSLSLVRRRALQPDRRPRGCAVQRTQRRIAQLERDQPGDTAAGGGIGAARVSSSVSATSASSTSAVAVTRPALPRIVSVCGSSPKS